MAIFQLWAEEVVTYFAEVEAKDATEANRIAQSFCVCWRIDGEQFRIVEVRNGS